ncbi:CBO0543 family protein [Paenibacillus sp. Soil787]|uniref:CBO0543 family protein n=1 Tax=Paenibacillus sp. Soil787 TaxID=1736411 RepID=UPI000703637E|nr:hypothetical protein ASG93_11425 [Paenibacillus sp. Soil787]
MVSILVNIILGFIIPWIFGLFLYKKASNIVILISPISSIISSVINAVGYHLEFWDFTPLIQNDETISALPFDIGLYPVTTSFMIYWIHSKNHKPIMSLLIFCALLTGIEFIGVLIHKVQYSNGWNLGWTFVSYFIAEIIVYGYYVLGKRQGINFNSKK